MQALCTRIIERAVEANDLFHDGDVFRFALRLAIRAIVLADVLCIVMHVGLDALGLLPYSLAQSLLIGTSVATVIAGAVEFMFAYYVGIALQQVSIDRDAFRKLSSSDPITGLMNRRAFMPMMATALPGQSLVILDIDRFKSINDTFGHAVGDRVIVEVSRALESALSDCSSGIARLGGEEFAVLLTVPPAFGPPRIQGALRRIANLELDHEGQTVGVTLSAGIAIFGGTADLEQVYRNADRALYLAKASGRSRVVHEQDADEVEQRLAQPFLAAG